MRPSGAGRAGRHVTVTDSSGDTLILPLVVPDGAARISTAHLWLQLLRAL